jgi:arginyl-tRNA synthetase
MTQDGECKVSEQDLDETAEKIGITAIKYFDLKQNLKSNYKFAFDKMLDPKGNTGVYLLYMYVRICSIQRKGGVSNPEINSIV